MLGDGEEYAAPGEDDFQCDDIPDYGELLGDPDDDDADGRPRDDHPSRNDGDGFDDDPQDDIPVVTFNGSGRVTSYERRSKFSATSKPGIFLGYHHETGSKWNGDYLVADLEDFKQNAKRPSVHQVKRVYCAPKERFLFPIRTVYDKRTRSICLDDPAMNDSGSLSAKRAKQSGQFDFDEGREASFHPADVPEPPEEVVISHGANVDYWKRDEAAHKWTYFVVVPRKAMVVPIRLPELWALLPKWAGYLRFESPMSTTKGNRLLSSVKRSGRLVKPGSCSIGRVMLSSLTLIVLLRSLRKPNMPPTRNMGFWGIIPVCHMSKKLSAANALTLGVASPIPLIPKHGVA